MRPRLSGPGNTIARTTSAGTTARTTRCPRQAALQQCAKPVGSAVWQVEGVSGARKSHTFFAATGLWREIQIIENKALTERRSKISHGLIRKPFVFNNF
jgi:hypothetical protein